MNLRRWLPLGLLLEPLPAFASDFDGIIIILAVPTVIVAALGLALVGFGTRHMSPGLARSVIRGFALGLVLAPTHTAGGHGQMWSVAIFDLMWLGGSKDYFFPALRNAAIAGAILSMVHLLWDILHGAEPRRHPRTQAIPPKTGRVSRRSNGERGRSFRRPDDRPTHADNSGRPRPGHRRCLG